MDLFKLIREFYIRQSVNPLSTGQIALWHGLVHQCNQLGWPSEFNMPNRTLEMLTGLSRQGIIKSRNALKQAGLIEIRTNGVKATTYSVVNISDSASDSRQPSVQDDSSMSDSRQGSGQGSGQGSRQHSRQHSRQGSSTYLRLDKTKQDETSPSDSQAPVHDADAFGRWQEIWGFPNAIAQGDLVNWIQEFGDELVTWVIEYAARRAVKAQSADKYIDRVLDGYRERKIVTIEQAEAEAKQHEQTAKANAPAPRSKYGRPARVEDTPEWLQSGYKPESKPATPEAKASINAGLDQLKMMREAKSNASAD